MGMQMTLNQQNIKNIVFATLLLIAFLFVSHKLLNIRTEALIKEKYTQVANEIQFMTKSYIDAKKESILFIALSLANDPRYIDAIASSNNINFKLDNFIENLQRNSKYNNVWIQVSDSKGISLY